MNVFKCETCQKTFASKQRLSSHAQRKTKCKPPPVYCDRIAVNFVLQGISYETLLKLIGSDKIVSSQYVSIENQKELGDNLPPLALNIVKQTDKKEEKKEDRKEKERETKQSLTEKDGELFEKQKEKMVEEIEKEYTQQITQINNKQRKRERKDTSDKYVGLNGGVQIQKKQLKMERDQKLRLLNKRKRLPNTNQPTPPQQPIHIAEPEEEQQEPTETDSIASIDQLKERIHYLDKSMTKLRKQAEDEAERENRMTAHCRELLEQVMKKEKERIQLRKRVKQVEKQQN